MIKSFLFYSFFHWRFRTAFWRSTNSSNSYPKIESTRTEGKNTFSIVSQLPTRELIKEWLCNPPSNHFSIIVAKSGQKHLYPWRMPAFNSDCFPVLFEQDTVLVTKDITRIFSIYNQLQSLGFTKTEIDSGNYRSDKILKHLDEWASLEDQWKYYRKSLLGELVGYCA